MENEDKRAEKVARMQSLWSQADENDDGRLNLEEFQTFTRWMKDEAKAEGDWAEEDDKSTDDYAILVAADDND